MKCTIHQGFAGGWFVEVFNDDGQKLMSECALTFLGARLKRRTMIRRVRHMAPVTIEART